MQRDVMKYNNDEEHTHRTAVRAHVAFWCTDKVLALESARLLDALCRTNTPPQQTQAGRFTQGR